MYLLAIEKEQSSKRYNVFWTIKVTAVFTTLATINRRLIPTYIVFLNNLPNLNMHWEVISFAHFTVLTMSCIVCMNSSNNEEIFKIY